MQLMLFDIAISVKFFCHTVLRSKTLAFGTSWLVYSVASPGSFFGV